MTTELPRDLVKRVIDRLADYEDCGPLGEGWQSELLVSDIAAMEAALAAPTAKGGTEDWRDDPSADERWNAGLDFGMQQLCAKLGVDPQDVSWDAATETADGDVRSVIGNILTQWAGDEWQDAPTRLASPPPPAGAAGGGSGDLGALSAGATPEIKATQITLGEGLVDITRIDHEGRVGVLFRPRAEHIPFGAPGELPEGQYWPVAGDVVLWVSGEGPQVAIDALAALAPTPDLGAQGEPVAWAYETQPAGIADWEQRVGFIEPVNTQGEIRNIRPLYDWPAPAAPRTGSGVSAEEIARTIVTHAYGKIDGSLKAAEQILALFAQAPRDGGETQGGRKLATSDILSARAIGWDCEHGAVEITLTGGRRVALPLSPPLTSI